MHDEVIIPMIIGLLSSDPEESQGFVVSNLKPTTATFLLATSSDLF